MELVKVDREHVRREIKLNTEKTSLRVAEMYLDLIKGCQNTFNENDIPIIINLQLQENHPKAVKFREIYYEVFPK